MKQSFSFGNIHYVMICLKLPMQVAYSNIRTLVVYVSDSIEFNKRVYLILFVIWLNIII